MYLTIGEGEDRRQIRFLHGTEDDWEDAMALAWRVFQRYDAKDYPPRGAESFLEFISGQDLKRMFMVGRYRLFVAKDGETMVGLISVRESNHLSLLFVDEKYHGLGVGRALMECVKDYLWEREEYPLENEAEKILDLLYVKEPDHYVTVFAAPGAVTFYKKLGFRQIGAQEETDGIIYVPMMLEEK